MKTRHKRLSFLLLGLAALGLASVFVLNAFNSNLVFFFSPSQVAAKEAPIGRSFRIGGMVEQGSRLRARVRISSMLIGVNLFRLR